jgi:hypothetical protein
VKLTDKASAAEARNKDTDWQSIMHVQTGTLKAKVDIICLLNDTFRWLLV